MISYFPPDEAQRLAALRQYAVMDTVPEKALDELTELAGQLCETPIALISLVDERRQWFKARVGTALLETPREISFCAHALHQTEVLTVPDAKLDARFAESPLVTGAEGVRFYAGAPLVAPGGEVLGTLCVMDRAPRTLSPGQIQTLMVLSRQVVTQMELQRQRRELADSDERLFAFLQHNPAATWIVDGEGRFCYVSPSFCAKFGGVEEEMIGKKLEDLFPAEYVEEYMAGNRAVIEEKRALQTVDSGPRVDGTIGQFLTVKFPIEAPIPLLGGMAIDITEHKEMENALRASEARFAAIFRANPAAVGITVLETGRIVDANERMCEFVGATREEMIGKTIAEMQVWVDIEKRKPLLEQLRKTGSAHDAEIQLRDRGGEVREVLASLERVEVPGESEPLLVTMFVDVTERKQAERELRRTTDLLQAVVAGTTDSIFVKDLEGRYLLFNDAAAAFLGRRKEEILGLSDQEIFGEEDARLLMEADRAVMESGEARTIMEKLGKGEAAHSFLSLKAPYRDGTGKIIGLVGIARDVTEREQAAAALRSHEEMLRETGRIARIGGWEFETATAKGTWTAEMAHIHELDPETKLTNEEAMAFYRGESKIRLEAALKEAVERGTPYDLELEFHSAKGTYKWVRTIGSPEVVDGRVVRVRGAFQDISERKRAEAHLRLLETCISRLNDIVMITEAEPQDEPGPRILFVNEAFVRWTGYTREEVIGRSPRFLQGPKTSRTELDRINASMRKWQPVRAELINYKKNGEEFWLDMEIVPVADATGWFTHWVAVQRDITQRKRTEARVRRLFESNAQGVIFFETDGRINEANEAFLNLTGYTRADIESGHINWVAMTPPEYVELDAIARAEIAARGNCTPYEKEFIRKDGTRVPVLLGAASFEDNPQEGVAFVLNLTERKEMERHILRAQRMDSIGTLASGIAHDLNNVLAPIIMAMQLLKMKCPDPESQQLITTVRETAKHGAEMVNQVLSFARGVEGQRVEVPLGHLAREIQKLTSETFPKDIRVRVDLPFDLWSIIGDSTQLHQVILNLCVNARDAMPAGGVLTMTGENRQLDAHYAAMNPEAKSGPYVLLRVQDNGIGIPPDVLEKIFDPFFSTKELGKGTGLGLSTTQAIVKSHGGFIRVRSEVGKGTQFEVYFPATRDVTAEAPFVEEELVRGRGELILVVDDEAPVREITRQTLEAFGYSVMLAPDGAVAVAIYASRHDEVAVVLTDLMMPVMGGAATIEVLRKINPDVPIIAVSGVANGRQVTQLEGLGVEHFLAKPYTAEALLKILHEMLSTRSPKPPGPVADLQPDGNRK